MEKIYADYSETCKLVSTKKETVAFLLQYSKSLQIVKHKEYHFECNIN